MKEKVNIVTFPHPINQIQDQVDFLTEFLDSAGVPYQISNWFSTDYPNILLEGFSLYFSHEIIQFCQKNNVKIGMMLTEHLELIKDTLFINETPLSTTREYMPDAVRRLHSLSMLAPHIRSLFVLGHLPFKKMLEQVFKTIPIIEVPYTKIPETSQVESSTVKKNADFCFQGTLTNYRIATLKSLKERSTVTVSFDHDPAKRLETLKLSRYAIQIPQHERWRYISTMRCLYCLKNGVTMINITDHVMHEFDNIFPRMSPGNIAEEVDKYLMTSPDKVFQETIKRYNKYVENQPKSKFVAMMKLWYDLDHTTSQSEHAV